MKTPLDSSDSRSRFAGEDKRYDLQLQNLEHDAPKLTDFGDNIMLQIIDFDHVYDFGLIQSKIIVI